MNWFNRHLNLSFLFTAIATTILLNVIAITDYFNDTVLTITAIVIIAIMSLSVEIWYLRQKGRSLWCLLFNCLNILGLIILLSLSNKRSLSSPPKDKVVL